MSYLFTTCSSFEIRHLIIYTCPLYQKFYIFTDISVNALCDINTYYNLTHIANCLAAMSIVHRSVFMYRGYKRNMPFENKIDFLLDLVPN